MGRELLFIPGHTEQTSDYPSLIKGLEQSGNHIFPLTMNWNGERNPIRWAGQVHEQIGDMYQPDTVVGFSYGGATALQVVGDLIVQGRIPRKLILCSHSAVFEDDYEEMQAYYEKKYSSKVPKGLCVVSIEPLIQTITSVEKPPEVVIFYGTREVSPIQERARKTSHSLRIKPRIIIGAKHNLELRAYAKSVIRQVNR